MSDEGKPVTVQMKVRRIYEEDVPEPTPQIIYVTKEKEDDTPWYVWVPCAIVFWSVVIGVIVKLCS